MAKDDSVGFALWKPTITCKLRKALLSDAFAWAIQNAIGVLFTMLFVVIGQMSFTLACVSTCLYSASSQVLSIDRTVGGRFFSAALFAGCMLSSGVLGGALSTLAWLAGGNPDGMLQYLPARFDKIPSKRDIGLIEFWFPKLAAIPLPPFVKEEWEKIRAEVNVAEQNLFPQPSSAFYILLMVLFIVVSLPFCVARADKDFKKGVLMAISTLFIGSQLIFATLMPTLGLRLFWTQITAGYIKVALVNSAAMVVTAIFLLSTSSYDNVREKLGCLLQGTGALMSKSASVICAISIDNTRNGININHNAEKGQGKEKDEKNQLEVNKAQRGQVLADLRDTQKIYEAMTLEVRALAKAKESTSPKQALLEEGKKRENKAPEPDDNDDIESVLVGEAPSVVSMKCSAKSAQELYADATTVEHALSATTFEIPLIGLTSQPGSVKAHYDAVLEAAVKLINVAGSIDALSRDAHFEINRALALRGNSPEVASIITTGRDAVGFVLASCAAVCSDLSVALRDMPLGGVCYGPRMAWKPRNTAVWAGLYSILKDAATALTPLVDKVAVDEGLEIVEKPFIEGRASLAALANCEMLLKTVQEVEYNASIALNVPMPEAVSAVAEKENFIEGDNRDEALEGNKKIVAQQPEIKPKSSIIDKIKTNGYLSSSLVLLVMGLGVPVWVEALKATVMLTKNTIKLIHSPRTSLREYKTAFQKNPHAQFALKFWFSMSLAMVGIILLLWKGEGNKKATLLENIGNVDYFFFVWQPIYFWITAVICTQKQVEATAFRALLRTTMTALGGTLGYCTMLNGTLAQNAYFVCAMVTLFNGVCGLFAPIKTLRYSMFLTAFTYNAVVACQYLGCGCDLPGDPKVFGGKVLSTLLGSLYAMVVSWLIWPYYTSEVMLQEEAEALKSGAELIARQEKIMKLKAGNGLDTSVKDNVNDIETTLNDKADVDNENNAIEEQLREPLARVKIELENNVLDRKQLLLTWNVLPTPRVVSILMENLSNLANYLEIAENVAESSLWTGAPGPSQAQLLTDLQPQMDAVLTHARAVAASCSECMAATNNASVHSTRAVVAKAVDELRSARASLRSSFLTWSDDKKGSAWTATTDFKFLAWIHLMLMAVREIEVIGVVLAETEASLDRDTFVTWASSCYGRRPVV